MSDIMIRIWQLFIKFCFISSPNWHIFAASQNSPEEHTWEQAADSLQVLAPPRTFSLQTVVPVSDSQSVFDMQWTEMCLPLLKHNKYIPYRLFTIYN